jgi:hypothetical protein
MQRAAHPYPEACTPNYREFTNGTLFWKLRSFSLGSNILRTQNVFKKITSKRIYSTHGMAPYWSHAETVSVSGILLVIYAVYSQYLASYWSPTQYFLRACAMIGHPHSILSVSGLLSVPHAVYSQYPASYWSAMHYILIPCAVTGDPHSIFLVSGHLLVTHTVYSQTLHCDWSPKPYILSFRHPTGPPHSIFSEPVLWLVSQSVYSHPLCCDWGVSGGGAAVQRRDARAVAVAVCHRLRGAGFGRVPQFAPAWPLRSASHPSYKRCVCGVCVCA